MLNQTPCLLSWYAEWLYDLMRNGAWWNHNKYTRNIGYVIRRYCFVNEAISIPRNFNKCSIPTLCVYVLMKYHIFYHAYDALAGVTEVSSVSGSLWFKLKINEVQNIYWKVYGNCRSDSQAHINMHGVRGREISSIPIIN